MIINCSLSKSAEIDRNDCLWQRFFGLVWQNMLSVCQLGGVFQHMLYIGYCIQMQLIYRVNTHFFFFV